MTKGKKKEEKRKEKLQDTAEIQRILRDYYKQLYANKMDSRRNRK